MNSSIYLFGNLGHGYTQYPDDYTKAILQVFSAESSSASQIAIHRDGNLMYYGYVRRLDGNEQYIGICVVLNGIMFTKVADLFTVFEDALSELVFNEKILQFDEFGQIFPLVRSLSDDLRELSRITKLVQDDLTTVESTVQKLPAVNFGVSKNDVKKFSDSDDAREIATASVSYGYTIVTKGKGDSRQMNNYKKILTRVTKENAILKQQQEDLKDTNYRLVNKQRYTLLIGVLSVIVAVLGATLYFKVLNPSEVTHYETDEFVYYGPLKDKQPHGVGVAVYPQDDVYGRKYYIGNFYEGQRQDGSAILYYQDGDFYYGSMYGDQLADGTFFLNSDSAYFKGEFDMNNQPYNGVWYDCVVRYQVRNGEIVEQQDDKKQEK